MKRSIFPLILIACVFLFSCVENPNSIGEEQTPIVKTEKKDKQISVYVHIVKNMDYLNILRQGVSTGKTPVKYGEIENIAQIIPKKSIARSVYFYDKHFSMDYERYQYRIRYRINGSYEFSQWSEAVSVASVWTEADSQPDGLNYITKNTDTINMAYRDNGKLTIKEIQKEWLPENQGNSFTMSDFHSTSETVYLTKTTYEDGYNPCLVFSYNDGENKNEKISRVFDISTLVHSDETGYYITPYVAEDYNVSTLVAPDFFSKKVLLEGFIGEKVTDNEDDAYTKIEWTSLSPVCLYEPKVVNKDDRKKSETEEPSYKYEKMDLDDETGYSIITIKSSNQSDNNHDYSNYEGVATDSRGLIRKRSFLNRDFSTYCGE